MEAWRTELYHYGIRGMRWGIKRGPPYPIGEISRGHRSDSAKPAPDETNQRNRREIARVVGIGAGAVALSLVAIGGMYVYKKSKIPAHLASYKFGSIIDVATLSDKAVTLKAGTKLQRISSKAFEDYVTNGRRIYAAYTKKDKRLYKEVMPDFIKSWANSGVIKDSDGTSYVHALTAKNPVRIASDRAMAETYMRVMGIDKLDAGKYQQFFADMAGENDSKTLEFFEAIRKLGYNAIIDKNDQGWAAAPLILLNPSEDIEQGKSHKLGKIERFLNTLMM